MEGDPALAEIYFDVFAIQLIRLLRERLKVYNDTYHTTIQLGGVTGHLEIRSYMWIRAY